jgi:hypothetical protein
MITTTKKSAPPDTNQGEIALPAGSQPFRSLREALGKAFLGLATITPLPPALTTATIATGALSTLATAGAIANVSAQEGAPHAGAGEEALIDFLNDLQIERGPRSTSAALKAINDDLETQKILDSTKPLAAAVLLERVEPHAASYIAEYLLLHNASRQEPSSLKEGVLELLEGYRAAYPPEQRLGDLFRAAIAQENSHQRRAYDELRRALPQEAFGDLVSSLSAAHTALGMAAPPSLRDSPYLLVGQRVIEGRPVRLSHDELIRVWHGIANTSDTTSQTKEPLIRAVTEQFLRAGNGGTKWNTEDLRQLFAQAPRKFQQAAIASLSLVTSSERRNAVLSSLPVELREEYKLLSQLSSSLPPHTQAQKTQEASYHDYLRLREPYSRVWGIDEKRALPSTLAQSDASQLRDALAEPRMRLQGNTYVSSAGEAYRLLLDPQSPLNNKIRAAFTADTTSPAYRDLATVVALYTSGRISKGECTLGLLVVHLQYPTTGASTAVEPLLTKHLQELGLLDLFCVTTGRADLPADINTFTTTVIMDAGSDAAYIDPAVQDICKVIAKCLPHTTTDQQDLFSLLPAVRAELARGFASDATVEGVADVLYEIISTGYPEKSKVSLALRMLDAFHAHHTSLDEENAHVAHIALGILHRTAMTEEQRARAASALGQCLQSMIKESPIQIRLDWAIKSVIHVLWSQDSSATGAPWKAQLLAQVLALLDEEHQDDQEAEQLARFSLETIWELRDMEAAYKPHVITALRGYIRSTISDPTNSGETNLLTALILHDLWRSRSAEGANQWSAELLNELLELFHQDTTRPEGPGTRSLFVLNSINGFQGRVSLSEEEHITARVFPLVTKLLTTPQKDSELYKAALNTLFSFQTEPQNNNTPTKWKAEFLLTILDDPKTPQGAKDEIIEKLVFVSTHPNIRIAPADLGNIKSRILTHTVQALETHLSTKNLEKSSAMLSALVLIHTPDDGVPFDSLAQQMMHLIRTAETDSQREDTLNALIGSATTGYFPKFGERLVELASLPELNGLFRDFTLSCVSEYVGAQLERHISWRIPQELYREVQSISDGLQTIIKKEPDDAVGIRAFVELVRIHTLDGIDASALAADAQLTAVFKRILETKITDDPGLTSLRASLVREAVHFPIYRKTLEAALQSETIDKEVKELRYLLGD